MHLVASTPGEPGKWFATVKTLKLFDQATRLAWASPCDPKTLRRAARDHLKTQPEFAMQCSLASLHWMSMGPGYELIGIDVQDAYRMAIEAASTTQQTEKTCRTCNRRCAHGKCHAQRCALQYLRNNFHTKGLSAMVTQK